MKHITLLNAKGSIGLVSDSEELDDKPVPVDEWEIGYFNTDAKGLLLVEPILGVRVNGGIWMEAQALVAHIEQAKIMLAKPQ